MIPRTSSSLEPGDVWEGVPTMDADARGVLTLSPRTHHARTLFSALPNRYGQVAEAWSFGQNGRWRRAMVRRVAAGLALRPAREPVVLDVATGPAAVALELARRSSAARIVGLDQSPEMLRAGVRNVRAAGADGRIRLLLGHGDRLPFEDATFDAVMFTYLLRYVDDPGAALRELARVLRPGGVLANLEFGVPRNPLWRTLWLAHTRFILPATGRLLSPGWLEAGRFLGPSISRFWRDHPLTEQVRLWREAGVDHVTVRPMSLGVGVVIWGTRRDIPASVPDGTIHA
jgi:demethylmenaquinone methyltransferase/2-methoxy-6-polyprenyl-1,4-benzoquinol methylase